MPCVDCGNRDYEIARKPVMRDDVCDACWELRGDLIDAMEAKRITPEQFRYAQTGGGLNRSERAKAVLA